MNPSESNIYRKSVFLDAEIDDLWRWIEVFIQDHFKSLLLDESKGGAVYQRNIQKIHDQHLICFTYDFEDYPIGSDISMVFEQFPGPINYIQLVKLNPDRTEIIFTSEEFMSGQWVMFWKDDFEKLEAELKKRWTWKAIGEKTDERDEVILENWRNGNTCREIGDEIGLSPGRVANIITDLRKKLGEEKVPKHK